MTAREMIPAIGAVVLVRCEDLQVRCTVQDVKSSYGRSRLLVTPIAGTGAQWVELARVELVTVNRCTWCGAEAGKPHHDRDYKDVIVSLQPCGKDTICQACQACQARWNAMLQSHFGVSQ